MADFRRATSQDDYPAAVSAAIEAGRGKCPKCYGSGKVAGGTDDLDAWPVWEALPPGSDIAVRLGMVYPMTCPDCDGTGIGPDAWESEVATLTRIFVQTGGRFTDGEKADWTARLTAALEQARREQL